MLSRYEMDTTDSTDLQGMKQATHDYLHDPAVEKVMGQLKGRLTRASADNATDVSFEGATEPEPEADMTLDT
jgi:hypothetical protein